MSISVLIQIGLGPMINTLAFFRAMLAKSTTNIGMHLAPMLRVKRWVFRTKSPIVQGRIIRLDLTTKTKIGPVRSGDIYKAETIATLHKRNGYKRSYRWPINPLESG